MTREIRKNLILTGCLLAGACLLSSQWTRRNERDWKVGGVGTGVPRSEVRRLKKVTSSESGVTGSPLSFTRDSDLFEVYFDQLDMTVAVWGFTLEGPGLLLSAGDSIQEIRHKLGEPDWANYSTSLYYRSDLVISVDHANGARAGSFTVCKYSAFSGDLQFSPNFPPELRQEVLRARQRQLKIPSIQSITQ